MKNLNRVTLFLAIAGTMGCAWWSFKLVREGKSILEVVNTIESVVSLLGLIIAILQIKSLKMIAVETKNAVEEAQASLILNVSISDLSRAIKISEQIQSYLGQRKFELAYTRLQELRELLVHFRNHSNIVTKSNEETYVNLLREIGIHLTNLFDAAFGTKQIHMQGINRTLGVVIETLIAFEYKLKYGGGESNAR